MKKILQAQLFIIILFCIFAFSACGAVDFKINFIVDGEIYATVSTNGGETVKMPDNPVKDDYTFDGWFWDKDTWSKPFTANSLLDTPLSSDMNVYCKWKEDQSPMERAEIVSANGFVFDGNNGKISVSNDTETYSFINQIQVNTKATWVISTDIYGLQTIATKTIPLNIGDNTIYLLVTSGDGNNINLYTMTVRRRPIYTVSFNTDGGTAVDYQQVEENSFATKPTTTKAGYTFDGWNYDFTKSIINNTEITASWTVNTDTPYKVEYYLENLDDNNLTLDYTENLTGTTDTKVSVSSVAKKYEHFSLLNSTTSANINGDGSTVLRVYYMRNKYHISISADTGVTLSNKFNGDYKYGYIIPQITASFNKDLGFEWQGWYSGSKIITNDFTIASFTVDSQINYIAKCPIIMEKSIFYYTTTENACTITGIKDKTVKEIVVPDCVTHIGRRAFEDCQNLETVIISNNVVSIGERAFYGCTCLYNVVYKSTGQWKISVSDNVRVFTHITAIDLKSTYSAYKWERV